MPVLVHGLVETQLAFRASVPALHLELRDGLRKAAEPVRLDAQSLAVTRIRRVTLPWSRMRVGVKAASVYVAPVARGAFARRYKRPNFSDLLMNRAMIPALNRNESKVVAAVEKAVDE